MAAPEGELSTSTLNHSKIDREKSSVSQFLLFSSESDTRKSTACYSIVAAHVMQPRLRNAIIGNFSGSPRTLRKNREKRSSITRE